MSASKQIFYSAISVFLVSIIISTWVSYKNFEGGLSHEFCHYAEIARNIKAGKGFKTKMAYPSTLAIFKSNKISFEEYAPVIDRFPLHAFATAAAFALWGESDESVLALSILALGALSAATAIVGALIFGWQTGLAAGLIIALTPSFQRGFLLWGLPDFEFAIILLLSVFFLVSLITKKDSSKLKWLLAGGVAAAAWLYRANFILWLPIFILWIAVKADSLKKGIKQSSLWLTGFLLVASPGIIYNFQNYSSLNPPTFAWNLAHMTITPNLPWLEYRQFSVLEILCQPLLLLKKWGHLFLSHLKVWPQMWQFHLIWPAAFISLFSVFRNKNRKNPEFDFFALFCVMIVFQVMAFCFLRFETLGAHVWGRYYIWLAPATAILSSKWILSLRPYLRWIYFTAVFLFFLKWLLMAPVSKVYPGNLPVEKWPEIEIAANCSSEKSFIAGNLPAQTAWYAGRKSIQLPVHPRELAEISKKYDIEAVLITRLSPGELYNLANWQILINNPEALKNFSKEMNLPFIINLKTSTLLCKNKPQTF
ncbi:MAG: glycosyltransferase family 39 protein [Elusimicrobia bacterium]|nr:glycosyltransferase family 39 protein [Elusimicrobiota bacterium]